MMQGYDGGKERRRACVLAGFSSSGPEVRNSVSRRRACPFLALAVLLPCKRRGLQEIPLREEASFVIPLPGSQDADGGNANDVVASDELPMGTLYVKSCERKKVNGKNNFS